MGEKNIKMNIEEFELMRKNIKYLDFYWMEYKSMNPQASKLEIAPSIEYFCENQLYEQLKKTKTNLFKTKVTLTNTHYEQLKEYNQLTYYVKELLDSLK